MVGGVFLNIFLNRLVGGNEDWIILGNLGVVLLGFYGMASCENLLGFENLVIGIGCNFFLLCFVFNTYNE
jgi:hypothetical protein